MTLLAARDADRCATTATKNVKPSGDSNDVDVVEVDTVTSSCCGSADAPRSSSSSDEDFVRDDAKVEICKQVLRCKLAKRRHLVLKEAIDPLYLDSLFPTLLKLFDPQHVTYNGGVANVKDWKISCYLEVMDGGLPTTHPNLELLSLFRPLLSACDGLFLHWYRQQHACNPVRLLTTTTPATDTAAVGATRSCRRLMTFITRYTPAPGEQALLKVRAEQFCSDVMPNGAVRGSDAVRRLPTCVVSPAPPLSPLTLHLHPLTTCD